MEVTYLRSMNYQARMMPLQLRKIRFKLPDIYKMGKLDVIGAVLCLEDFNHMEERLMMRVDNIKHRKG